MVVGQLLAPGDVQDPADLDAPGCGPALGLVEGLSVRSLAPAPGADVMDRRGRDLRPADALVGQLLGEGVGAADQVVGRAQHREAGAEQLDEVEEVAEPIALGQLRLGLDPEIDAVALGQCQHRRRPHGPLEVDVELDLRQGGDRLGGNGSGGGDQTWRPARLTSERRGRPPARRRIPGTWPASRSA